jgi:glucose-6-phosphate 1-dehydrogenase
MIDATLQQSDNRSLIPEPTALVIFGVTGDLSQKKLLPALYKLAEDEFLPSHFQLIGCSRKEMSKSEFQEIIRTALEKNLGESIRSEVWESFAACLSPLQLDSSNTADFQRLQDRIHLLEQESGTVLNALYYLATAPEQFAPIAEQLGRVGLIEPFQGGGKSTSIVIEKPFGHDLESARALNALLLKHFDERQIYRIDHYLGKETVQNILVFRFGNGIFEPLWNHQHIDHIQITVAEPIGLENRADYFDKAGILRDIVQNHVMQMLSLLCIEPPYSLSSADSIRDEKVKVLRCVKRMSDVDVVRKTVRAQYSSGFSNGEPVGSYLEERGVAADSQTETFVALQLEIDNWRWTGVPIYIRVGKRLPKKITEIAIVFKKPPFSPFPDRQVHEIEANVLSIRVQPNEGISLSMNAKPPGPRMRVNNVKMDFAYGYSYGARSAGAYERLILDALRGDPTLFARNDEIEEAWDIMEPILRVWSKTSGATDVFQYQAGTWGPKAASDLILRRQKQWRQL